MKTLVAGVGNIFLGDDAFGVEVARRLLGADGSGAGLPAEPLPDGVKVVDFGIRGVHLAYELLDGYDTLILVDATPRGEPPGTITVIEPEIADVPPEGAMVNGHGMEPDAVFALLRSLGGDVGRALVVGCEPESVGEGIGLSAPVAGAVDAAVAVVRDLLDEQRGDRGASPYQRAVARAPTEAVARATEEESP